MLCANESVSPAAFVPIPSTEAWSESVA
jgi:hypothetical protein